MRNRILSGALAAGLLIGAGTAPDAVAGRSERVRLLGAVSLPHALRFEGTTVGGLSGIDHDPRTGEWLLISDDRSQLQPSRFYRADIDLGPGGVRDVELTGTSPLLRADGEVYGPGEVDPEEIRFDPRTRRLCWTSEGDRGERLVDPAIRWTGPDGGFAGELPLPESLRMTGDSGPRRNKALEGMTFAAGGRLVVTATEGPLVQDGEPPTPEHGALGRITVQSRTGRVLSQHAYPMDAVFAEPQPAGETADNGVASVLATRDPFRYLVLERAFVSGVGNSIRIYGIDLRGATDVRGVHSLREAPVRPVRKRLLADLSRLGLTDVDNVEGMAWGPRLRGGERTLVLVSDDNFSAAQTTQIIALALR